MNLLFDMWQLWGIASDAIFKARFGWMVGSSVNIEMRSFSTYRVHSLAILYVAGFYIKHTHLIGTIWDLADDRP